MSRLFVIALGLVLPVAVRAQDEALPFETWIGDLRVWVEENLDEEALEAVGLDAGEIDAQLRRLQEAAAQQPPSPPPPTRADAEMLVDVLSRFDVTQEGATWMRGLLAAHSADSPSDVPSEKVVPPPADHRDPLRMAWEQRLAGSQPPARAADHVPLLKKVFSAEGVPPELVWIAEVESSFDPGARSRVGAVGLFQLMPDTAEELGLSINLLEDQRRDPEVCARAAARYLRSLRRQFQDWPLTLAAYNAGPGRVTHLLSITEEGGFAAIAHRLPEETRHFVPRVEATVWIREGVELRDLPASAASSTRGRVPVSVMPASGSLGPHERRGWAIRPVGGGG